MKTLGDYYEDQAVTLINNAGLLLRKRNFRTKIGEIDLIVKDKAQLVFIEVRARSNRRFDSAAGSVNARKRARIVRTAQLFLQQSPNLTNMPCRFDVIAFEPPQFGPEPRMRWIRSAFTA